MRKIMTGKFRLESVVILVLLQEMSIQTTKILGRKKSHYTIQKESSGGAIQKKINSGGHEAFQNPALQVGPGFKLSLEMEMAKEIMGEAVNIAVAGHLFCLSYHLKGVYNSNRGVRHAHRRL